MKRVSIFSHDLETAAILQREIHREGFDVIAHPLDENMIVLARADKPAAVVLNSGMSWRTLAPLITDLKSDFQLRDIKIIAVSSDPAGRERLAKLMVHNLYLLDFPLDPQKLVALLNHIFGKTA